MNSPTEFRSSARGFIFVEMDAPLVLLRTISAKLDTIIANQQGGEAEVIGTLTCTQNDDVENGTLTFAVQFENEDWTISGVAGYSGSTTYNTLVSYADEVLTITERVPLWGCESWSVSFKNTSTSNTAILYFDLHCAVGTTYTVMAVQK